MEIQIIAFFVKHMQSGNLAFLRTLRTEIKGYCQAFSSLGFNFLVSFSHNFKQRFPLCRLIFVVLHSTVCHFPAHFCNCSNAVVVNDVPVCVVTAVTKPRDNRISQDFPAKTFIYYSNSSFLSFHSMYFFFLTSRFF